jgi:hypothetical protein
MAAIGPYTEYGSLLETDRGFYYIQTALQTVTITKEMVEAIVFRENSRIATFKKERLERRLVGCHCSVIDSPNIREDVGRTHSENDRESEQNMLTIKVCEWSGNLILSKSPTQEITLDLESYYKLKELIPKLEVKDFSTRYELSRASGLKVGWSDFSDKQFLHIRRWTFNDKPTHTGVTFNDDEYKMLRDVLSESLEMELFKMACAEDLKDKAMSLLRTTCDGCALNHSSQTHHTCLMTTTEDAIDAYLSEKPWLPLYSEIVLRAAQEANRRRYVIKNPKLHLDVIGAVMQDAVKKMAKQL